MNNSFNLNYFVTKVTNMYTNTYYRDSISIYPSKGMITNLSYFEEGEGNEIREEFNVDDDLMNDIIEWVRNNLTFACELQADEYNDACIVYDTSSIHSHESAVIIYKD